MVRDENLEVVLKCIIEELNGAIRSEVQTPYTRGMVDALTAVLGRLIADAGGTRKVAESQKEDWNKIAAEFDSLGLGKLASPFEVSNNPLQLVEHTTHAIQQALLTDNGRSKLTEKLRSGDQSTIDWFNNTAKTLNTLLQAEEELFYRPKGRKKGTKSVANNLELLEANLNRFLCQKYPALPPTPIKRFALIPGGQIKRTVIFEVEKNTVLPSRLVLRQDMDMEYTGTTVVDEFEILKRVYDLGVPVPQPLLLEANEATLGDGGCFMIMTEVEDAKPAGTYFGEDRAVLGDNMGPDIGRQIAQAVAQLHGKTLVTTPGAGDKAIQAQQEKYQDFKEKWSHQAKPAFTLSVDMGIAWMDANPLNNDRPYCLRHGDLGAHNMMTRDGNLAALIDWELAGMGDPAADICQLKMMLLDFVIPWEEFKEIYIAEGGPPGGVDDHAVAYYSVWNYFFHLSMATNLWENFTKGARDDAQAADVSCASMTRLALYESRALATAIELGRSN
jgi:aminoglycoside phosphotransferase (APT) family kinase protein